MTSETTMVEVMFSRDGRMYYVTKSDHQRPRDWVAVDVGADGKFEVLPFAVYDVKSGEAKMLPESDPLVVRYWYSQGWPERGSAEWRAEVVRVRGNAEASLADEQRSAQFYVNEIARLDALLAAHPEVPS